MAYVRGEGVRDDDVVTILIPLGVGEQRKGGVGVLPGRKSDGRTLTVSVDAGDARRPLVVVGGDLDFTTAGELRMELDDLLSGRPDVITLDFASLEFIDSTGLSVIVHAWQAAHDTGTEVRLGAVPRFLATILDITGVAGLLGEGPGRFPAQPPGLSA